MKKFINALSLVLPVVLMLAVSFSGPIKALATVEVDGEHKVDICHKNGESGNWNVLNVDQNGWNGHSGHDSDYLYTGGDLDNKAKWCKDHSEGSGEGDISTATINATKIVCSSEADLPNWGLGGGPITATTATDWVTSHESCHLQSGWSFEYGNQSTSNPGDDLVGAGGAGFTAFGPTNANGLATTIVPISNITEFHLREVLQSGYIPFTYAADGNTNNVSAEFYCANDVLNYDNFDFIRNPEKNTTYNCVAWNVLKTQDEPKLCPVPSATVGANTDTTIENINNAPQGENDLQLSLNAYSVNATTDQTQIQLWNVAPNSTVTINSKYVSKFSGHVAVFGYYTNSSMTNFVPVFKTANVAGYGTTPMDTDNGGMFTVNVGSANTIGFAIKTFYNDVNMGDFASENALNTSASDQVVVYNPSANKYVLGFEDLIDGDSDYNDLVVEVSMSCDVTPPPVCEATDVSNIIVSDTTTLEGLDSSVLVSPVNGGWVSSIGSSLAQWIWGENPLSQSTSDKTEVFTKTFTIIGTPKDSTLELAADNSFSVTVNGHAVGADTTEFNYGATKTYPIPASYLLNGSNTIEFTVKNLGLAESTPTTNPAGLIYKLTVNEDDCVIPPPVCPEGYTGTYPNCIPPVVVVDVCSNLPGNQSSLPEGYTQNGEQCFSQNQCSDGIDNSDSEDTLVDSADPACHTDGNAENSESYNPSDNDETNTPTITTTSRHSNSSGSRPTTGRVLGAETSVCNWDINTYMRKGYKNNPEQVKILQRDLLNGYMKANVPVDGNYGPLTEAAVKAFQVAKKDKILVPWNLTLPTGIFYKTTLVEAKNTICPEKILPIPSDLIPWSKNTSLIAPVL